MVRRTLRILDHLNHLLVPFNRQGVGSTPTTSEESSCDTGGVSTWQMQSK